MQLLLFELVQVKQNISSIPPYFFSFFRLNSFDLFLFLLVLFCGAFFFSQGAYVTGRGVPGSGGVDIGKVQLMLKARPLQGMRVDPATGARRKVTYHRKTPQIATVCVG